MVNSEDEILHASLYQWLIDNQHTDRLLGIQSPYLENYLKRGIAQHPDQLALFDIIWKYYERNGQYFLAAKILDKLSSRHRWVLIGRATSQIISIDIEYFGVHCIQDPNRIFGICNVTYPGYDKIQSTFNTVL